MSGPIQPISLLTGVFDRLVNSVAPSPFNLRRLEDFPFVEWSNMQEYYKPLVEWFEGTPLHEKIVDKDSGVAVDKFPIKLNPIPGTCEKHTSVLLGNTLESIREGGMPIRFIPDSSVEEGQVKIITDAIRKAFEYAGGGAMFVDAGMTSQYMGGCVWKVRFDDENEEFPVQVSNIDPTEFFGIPKGSNYWEFHEAWMVREITLHDAKRYGYVDQMAFYRAVGAGLPSEGLLGFVWWGGKVAAVLFVFIWLRGTLPRFRYDQLMNLGWKVLIPVAAVWILITATGVALAGG